MRELLTGETGKALYARRKATVEPVFGQIKEAWDSQIPVPWSEECSLRMETHLCHAQSAKALPLSGRPRLHLSSFEGRSRLFIVLKARFLRRKRRRNNMLAVIWYFDLRCVFLAVRIAPLLRLLSDRLLRACRRENFLNEEWITYRDSARRNLLILRSENSISDRLSG